MTKTATNLIRFTAAVDPQNDSDQPGRRARIANERFQDMTNDVDGSAASDCYAAKWIMCGDKMPEAGMECVVLVHYSEDDEPFTAIARYELQKEDSLGREIGDAEYAYGWNDYFECDVLAWFPVPTYSGIKLRANDSVNRAATG